MTHIDQNTSLIHPVISDLLGVVDEDPTPDGHTSSHWNHHSDQIVVGSKGEDLILKDSGFGSMHARRSLLNSVARRIERFSYRSATKRIQSYSEIFAISKILTKDLSFDLTYNVWNQTTAVSVLTDHFRQYNLSPNVFALIGDGHGFMGALIKRGFPKSKIYEIDLPKVLVFQANTHNIAKSGRMTTLTDKKHLDNEADIIFVPPQHAELIPDNIDCAVNMSSMAEMTEVSISSYFNFLRERSLPESRFYCVNRLEKRLIGGEVNRFYNYPWHSSDIKYIDEPCPYYTHIISSETSSNGPRILGRRIPYISYFGGQMIHRLVNLSSAS